jgi:hypothetical protein
MAKCVHCPFIARYKGAIKGKSTYVWRVVVEANIT